MERLTPLAASFLEAEDVDPAASLAIGSLATFEGPAPSFEEFMEAVRGRLPLIPRYRQRLLLTPFGLAAPAWVDDPDFDLGHHVRRTSVPGPGSRDEVATLVSSLMTRRMDRDRPMWEYWFCEGLEDGRWGLLSKLHHCLADGVSGTDLYRLVLDPTPVPRPPVPDTWTPAAPVSPLGLTTRAVWELVGSPVHAARVATQALGQPVRLARAAADSTQGLLRLAGAARPVHSTSLTGPLGGGRRYAWTRTSLEDVRVVRRAYKVTVNDVALAAVTGGFRRLLLARGETPDPRALRSLVPVSTRAPGEESVTDNRVSLMLPYLPVDVADPVERLAVMHRRIKELRAAHEPEAGGSLTTLAELGPFPTVSLGMRLGLRLPQHQVATVTTNVPGPRTSLYALGREVQEILPYVPIADRVRIGVAIFSYRDALTYGVTADHDTTPDLDVLVDGVEESFAELLQQARTSV